MNIREQSFQSLADSFSGEPYSLLLFGKLPDGSQFLIREITPTSSTSPPTRGRGRPKKHSTKDSNKTIAKPSPDAQYEEFKSVFLKTMSFDPKFIVSSKSVTDTLSPLLSFPLHNNSTTPSMMNRLIVDFPSITKSKTSKGIIYEGFGCSGILIERKKDKKSSFTPPKVGTILKDVIIVPNPEYKPPAPPVIHPISSSGYFDEEDIEEKQEEEDIEEDIEEDTKDSIQNPSLTLRVPKIAKKLFASREEQLERDHIAKLKDADREWWIQKSIGREAALKISPVVKVVDLSVVPNHSQLLEKFNPYDVPPSSPPPPRYTVEKVITPSVVESPKVSLPVIQIAKPSTVTIPKITVPPVTIPKITVPPVVIPQIKPRSA